MNQWSEKQFPSCAWLIVLNDYLLRICALLNGLNAIVAFVRWNGVGFVLAIHDFPSGLKSSVINVCTVVPLSLWIQIVLNYEWLVANLLNRSNVIRVVLNLLALNGIVIRKRWLVEAPQSAHISGVTVVRSIVPVWTHVGKRERVSTAILNIVTRLWIVVTLVNLRHWKSASVGSIYTCGWLFGHTALSFACRSGSCATASAEQHCNRKCSCGEYS